MRIERYAIEETIFQPARSAKSRHSSSAAVNLILFCKLATKYDAFRNSYFHETIYQPSGERHGYRLIEAHLGIQLFSEGDSEYWFSRSCRYAMHFMQKPEWTGYIQNKHRAGQRPAIVLRMQLQPGERDLHREFFFNFPYLL